MYVEYAVVFHYALCGIVLIPDQSVQSSVSQCSAVDRSFLLSPLSVCTHSLSVSATGQLQAAMKMKEREERRSSFLKLIYFNTFKGCGRSLFFSYYYALNNVPP